tara:strand:- start:1975 stop:3168 length:1194 start_codon:yes stop_codon:yes gene_type:complete
MERKTYLILGSLIFLSILFIYKFSSSGEDKSITTPINSAENLDDFKRVINKLSKLIDKDRKTNKLLLNEVKKLNQLNKLQTKYLKGIKPKIFGKDIEKHRVYIDTHNIRNITDRSNYVYYFNTANTENTNQTAGYTEINNIIGFRLVKAIFPNTHNVVTNTNNIVLIQLGDNALESESAVNSDISGKIQIVLATGNYTTNQLSNAFDPTLQASYSWFQPPSNPVTSTNNLGTTYRISVSYDPTLKKFTFTMAGGYKFRFIWDEIENNSAHNLLGFNKVTTPSDEQYSNLIRSVIHPNMSTHYIDLIVDEIPYIACKKNAIGKKLIERIAITGGFGELIQYIQPWDSDYENYFFPISLSKLTIHIQEPTQNHFFDDTRDHTLEFEITTIKNPKEFNLI